MHNHESLGALTSKLKEQYECTTFESFDVNWSYRGMLEEVLNMFEQVSSHVGFSLSITDENHHRLL